jgi:hypothetical protein
VNGEFDWDSEISELGDLARTVKVNELEFGWDNESD